MAKGKSKDILVVLPKGIASYVHVYEPDSKAPEGAAFKPDNRYKITLIYDDEAELEAVKAKIVAAAKEKWKDLDVEELRLPWRLREDDDKNERLRGKVTCIAKSQFKPSVFDAHRNPVPETTKVRGGDVCKASATVYLYEKTEKVREGRKMVDVMTRGVSLQLSKVQLIEKRSFGGAASADEFDDEDGFTVAEGDNEAGDSADDPGSDF